MRKVREISSPKRKENRTSSRKSRWDEARRGFLDYPAPRSSDSQTRTFFARFGRVPAPFRSPPIHRPQPSLPSSISPFHFRLSSFHSTGPHSRRLKNRLWVKSSRGSSRAVPPRAAAPFPGWFFTRPAAKKSRETATRPKEPVEPDRLGSRIDRAHGGTTRDASWKPSDRHARMLRGESEQSGSSNRGPERDETSKNLKLTVQRANSSP